MKLYNISRLGSALSVAFVLVGSLLGSVKAQTPCIPDVTTLQAARDAYLANPDTYMDTGLHPENVETSAYGPIEDWCFAPTLTNFGSLFEFITNIPPSMDISRWDTKDVTNMVYTFYGSTFNGDISNWNVGKVTNMENMFSHAQLFNRDISNWNVEKVQVFWSMFFQANSFNQDLSSWNVGAGTNFNYMFNSASAFNQDLCPWGAIINTDATKPEMFSSSGCSNTLSPNFDNNPVGPFCYDCTANPPNAGGESQGETQGETQAEPVCDGEDWCVEFQSFVPEPTVQDGVSLTYTASEPTDTANPTDPSKDKYYEVMLMDANTCKTPAHSSVGVASVAFASGFLTLGLSIDTSTIETYDGGSGTGLAFPLDPPVDHKFKAMFCAKVDLFNKVDGNVFKVETSETVLTLRFDKTKNFEFTITANKEDRGTRATDVQINHELDACVCALGNDAPANPSTCLSGYTLNPGDYFKFCVKDKNPGGEATLASIKDVAFRNRDDADVNIPIVSSAGEGVGPSMDGVACNSGECVVTARTYARMYEKVNGETNVVTDISTGSEIAGTAVLAFNRRRRNLVRGSNNDVEEKELVVVNFDSAGRVLQQDGTTPVNDFDVNVNLATPPDRSSASSGAMAFASLIMAGSLAGLMML